jgi:hypothetical protein
MGNNLTDKQAQQIFDSLVKIAMETVKIPKRTAELRIKAIIKSGIMNELGSPDGQPFQIGIDVAMRIPQLGEKE